jgi:phenylacetate-CoA ligase
MPMIRYRTGDMATVSQTAKAFVLNNVVGRIHDLVPINGIDHATHHVQDMLDHRVGGVQEFQIDLRTSPPTLRIVPEASASTDEILAKIKGFWQDGFDVQFVGHDELVRVGHQAKFRHVVHP